MDEKKQLLALLHKKEEGLKELLRLTKNTRFKQDDDDPENYINLIDKREEIVNALKILDQDMALPEYKAAWQCHDAEFHREVELTQKAVKEISAEILKEDQALSQQVPEVLQRLKDNLKGINVGKSLSNLYQSAADVGSRFDKSK